MSVNPSAMLGLACCYRTIQTELRPYAFFPMMPGMSAFSSRYSGWREIVMMAF